MVIASNYQARALYIMHAHNKNLPILFTMKIIIVSAKVQQTS